jgi:hypothetical protein
MEFFRLNVYLQLVWVIFGTYITNNKAIKITIFDLFDASMKAFGNDTCFGT